MSLKHASIAANRFGLGARPGDLSRIAQDPKAWLHAQIDPNIEWPEAVKAMPPTGARSVDFPFFRSEAEIRMISERLARGADGQNMMDGMSPSGDSEGMKNPTRRTMGMRQRPGGAANGMQGAMTERFMVYPRAVKRRFDIAVETETPFYERLVHFWSNHFVVSGAKPTARGMLGTFERDVARKHVMGNFTDMLIASSQHPAMQFYLDNFTSIGPNSEWGLNPELVPKVSEVHGRPEGLNENLAREILELHTVGVNGGYTQEDVRNFAKAITGWGQDLERRKKPRPRNFRTLSDTEIFYFNEKAHEPGPQMIMGKVYNQPGVEQGLAVLRDLGRHPETANFIAFKLARHFISDTPPPEVVAALSKAFLESGGDLPTVYATLVERPEAWQDGYLKVRTPEDYLVAAHRALGGIETTPRGLLELLTSLGQPTYQQGGPDGWPDVADHWSGPDALWKRLEWATQISERVAEADLAPSDLAKDLLGPRLTAKTRQEIERAESPEQGTALLLVSPEFLRR